ncbi:M28 family peptidase, partial [Nodularia spumigena]|uniref:M28 family peptidase n=1 Tax=Nodularia spumigena TaxID=70799 RepID=UPI002B1FC21D
EATAATQLNEFNVAAFIPGTDSKLKNELILVTAHYDHVGYKKGMPADQDSIYNGARDNAVGTVALLVGAKVLTQIKPKRSVMLLALTAEEEGLLGSRFYVQNPLFPLNQTVFNLNLDGAGYNDTTIATIVGLGNYKQDSLLINAVDAAGITAK